MDNNIENKLKTATVKDLKWLCNIPVPKFGAKIRVRGLKTEFERLEFKLAWSFL
jgi:hypothetical protein